MSILKKISVLFTPLLCLDISVSIIIYIYIYIHITMGKLMSKLRKKENNTDISLYQIYLTNILENLQVL